MFLLITGVVLILQKLVALSPSQALKEISDVGKYVSLPLGLGIKLFQYLDSKLKKMEEIKDIALANKRNDESLREQIKFTRDDFIFNRTEFLDSLLELDKRMIRIEARSELNTKIERLERLVNEQIDRLNKLQ